MEDSGLKEESEPEIEVVFDYSIDDEIGEVGYLLRKYEWFKEKGYKIKFPESIRQKLEGGEKITEDDISEAVSTEFNPSEQAEKIATIKEGWDKIKEAFFENLKTLGLPLQDKYFVAITKYGAGGSYGVPNHVQLKIEQKREVLLTLAHEIVHLTIEHLIKEYSIDHWTKERLVDLIMNRFFPENPKLQRDPANSEKISELFGNYFSDIRKIIEEISKLESPK